LSLLLEASENDIQNNEQTRECGQKYPEENERSQISPQNIERNAN
jgi:hypothetical protein